MRFDGKRYVDCRWCRGTGCLYCKAEADKAYKAAFPDGPVPIAVVTVDELENNAAVRAAIDATAVTKAFSEGAGVIDSYRTKTPDKRKSH